MDKYKKITDLGLKVYPISQSYVVLAEDLLELLNAGVEVTGRHHIVWEFSEMNYDSHIYQAIVIGIKEPNPKQVTITRADLDKAYDNAQYL